MPANSSTTNIPVQDEQFIEAKQIYQGLWDSGQLACILLDLDGKVSGWSPAAERMFGWSEAEMLGQTLAGLALQTCEVSQSLAQGQEEFRATGKDGITLVIRLSKMSLRDKAADPTGTLLLVNDIRERKRLEEDLRRIIQKEQELSELKSHFVAVTSHEFRTPLSVILSSTELLEHYSDRLSEEKKSQYFARIKEGVEHLTKMLDDILV